VLREAWCVPKPPQNVISFSCVENSLYFVDIEHFSVINYTSVQHGPKQIGVIFWWRESNLNFINEFCQLKLLRIFPKFLSVLLKLKRAKRDRESSIFCHCS
jgi:hypothetical protein